MTAFHLLFTLDRAFNLRDPQNESILGNNSDGASSFIHSKTFFLAGLEVVERMR